MLVASKESTRGQDAGFRPIFSKTSLFILVALWRFQHIEL